MRYLHFLAGVAALTAPLLSVDSSEGASKGKALRQEPSATVRSVGSPTEGKLVGGKRLEEGPHLRIVPSYAGGDVRWGLPGLVDMTERAAKHVRRMYPDAVLSVGHLSRLGGGDVQRHHSHESGRDIDVGFYLQGPQGKPALPARFLTIRHDGRAAAHAGISFDDAKNWAFIESVVTDPGARVTHIFVVTHLRGRLLAYAERAGRPAHIRARAAELMAQPKGALPHDDHFHIRIGCPGRMKGCVENPTRSRELGSSRGKKNGKSVHASWIRGKQTPARSKNAHPPLKTKRGAETLPPSTHSSSHRAPDNHPPETP